ncbi:MAG: hypothetical protein AAGF99_18130 [Bacteroidota bacterium]
MPRRSYSSLQTLIEGIVIDAFVEGSSMDSDAPSTVCARYVANWLGTLRQTEVMALLAEHRQRFQEDQEVVRAALETDD